jgi:hypothetical protein
MMEDVQTFPGYDVQGHVVWGLTLRMLDYMFSVVDPEWRPHFD